MTRILLTLLFAPLFLLAQNPFERRFASAVSEERLLEHVKTLVGFGNRQGGTPSGDAAAKYVRRQFRAFGLPTAVDTNSERLVFINHAWSLTIQEPKRLQKMFRNEWLSGYSPSTRATMGTLVYLSEDQPVHNTSFDGCVVLTGRPISPALYGDLVKGGTVCVLSYAPNDSLLYPDWAMIGDLPASDENRIPAFNISYDNGRRLKRELDNGTRILVKFSTRTEMKKGKPKTVVATLKGEGDEYLMVCAHGDSDSGGPGADDNASGVAGVLELSRALSEMVAMRQLPRPRKSIKFVIWGSEYHSSTEYAKEHAADLEKILAVVNYDEIGTGATRNCLYFEGNDIAANEPLLRTLNAIGEEYAGKHMFWQEATTNPAQGGTDSYVFLPEYLDRLGLPAAAIPSITVYTAAWNEAKTIPQTKGWSSKAWKGHPDSVTVDFSRYYHSSLDVPALTTEKEPFNMSWAVRGVGIALLRMAWGDRVP